FGGSCAGFPLRRRDGRSRMCRRTGRSRLMNALLKSLRWPTQERDRYRLALWGSEDIAEATGGAASGEFQAGGVETDSRDVRSGDLFFALKGENSDGHVYLDKAFANGAVASVVEWPIAQPHVLVSATSRALE